MIGWIGNRDMTFHRLDREEILSEFLWIKRHVGKYKKSRVVVLDRRGKKSHVVRVKEDVNGVFLYRFEESFADLLALAPVMGSDLKIMDFDAVYDALKQGVHRDVWLQWPSEDPHTVVGKILGVMVEGELVVSLVPVPKDIEELNREVRRRVAKKCKFANNYSNCGKCPMLGGCEVLKEVDDEIGREREGKGRPEDAGKGKA